MEKFNISKPEKYIGKDGVEKTYWNNVGTLTKFFKQDGTTSTIIEIPAIGLKANVFPITPKPVETQILPVAKEPIIDPSDGRDLTPDDTIPF